MSVALHWFRTDLRVEDNPGLLAAQQSGLPVVALYIATPGQWQLHDDAPIKLDFWRRNLLALDAALQKLGIPLLCEQADSYRDIPARFEQLLPALQVAELHCNTEYPLNERKRDEAVAAVCRRQGVQMQQHLDQVLVEPAALLNKSGEPFKVFTPYARTARVMLPPVVNATKLRKQQSPELPALPHSKSVDELTFAAVDKEWDKAWPAGEKHAMQRLTLFCQQRITEYKTQRDIPSVNGTSTISAYLAAGVLSVRQCWQASQQWQEGEGVLVWQNELLWHDFYKYIVYHYPHVCQHKPWKNDVGHVPWRHDKKEFQLWCEGRTGIPIIDAAMRQLLQTGWMHNRLRMLVAMFLTKHLLIDWRWGERWFMQHLIDGDFAANNGGWQWSASTGTDAVPYFRIFNPVTQSRRFDPDGDFLRRFLPELATLDNHTIHDPGLLRPASYPPPMLELAFGRERALQAFKRQDSLLL
ncbi:MAG: deoxyribodipyrimidine photo-lyase [Pseudomonadota bacterium]